MADTRGPREFSLDESVDAAATAMGGGESLERALSRFPQRAGAMRAPLSALEPVLAIPQVITSPASRSNAARAMFAALAAPSRRRTTRLAGAWAALSAGSLRYKAAVAGLAVVLFGGIGFASAAGDSSPVRVPSFLHVLSISSDNAIEFHGEVLSATSDSLVLQTSGGDRTLTIDAATVIRVEGAPATVADLAPGQTADARGTRAADGVLRATRITAVAPTRPPPATVAPGLPPASELQPPAPRGDDNHPDGNGVPGIAQSPETGDDGHESGAPKSDGGDAEHSHSATGSATPGPGERRDNEDRTQAPAAAKTAIAAPGGHASPTPERSGEHGSDGEHGGGETPQPDNH